MHFSNKLYDLDIKKGAMRGNTGWNLDSHPEEEEILTGSVTPNVNKDKLVSRTEMAQRKVTVIPSCNGSITAYENPARKLLFEESYI